jgi:DNA (cytosine-5)-methyltransferase 1
MGAEEGFMKSIELFAGIGGIALAAEWAMIETIAFCERDPFCQKVLNKHWPDVPIFDDVCTLDRKMLEQRGVIEPGGTVDIISGGYPCQPFSVAGERKGEEDDRHLWPEVKRLLEEIRPTWFVGENVAGHVTLGLDQVLLDLENIGYTWQPFVIPACAVNANHRRNRVFIVAHSDRKRLREHNPTTESKNKGFSNRGDIEEILRYTHSKPKPQKNKTVSTIGSKWEARKSSSWKYRGTTSGDHWENDQPTVCRVDDGISKRLDKSRLKALGNAVVPQQIYPIFKYIMEIERMNNQ